MMSIGKRVNKALYVLMLSRMKTSFHAKFQVYCSDGLPVFTKYGLHYNVLSGLRNDISVH